MTVLEIARESWPIAGSFTIARGSKTVADVVVVTLRRGARQGRGECVPYPRYGETVEGVAAALERARAAIEAGARRDDVPRLVEPRAARNALDCALWDLEAKCSGMPVWQLAGLAAPEPVITAFTLSLDRPEAMAGAARLAADRPLLKIKLGQDGDEERLRCIREAAPAARLIVDANEGWTAGKLEALLSVCAETGVELVEQPLPAADDEALRHVARSVPVCADESLHDRGGLASLVGKYDAINIKLDKTGGLTEALALAQQARRMGFKLMVGCMLATSLGMAPAVLLAQLADVVDLDGPLLLKRDRLPGLRYEGSLMHPPSPALWG